MVRGAVGRGTVNPALDTLSLIRADFPDQDELVERAYRSNGSFHDLCNDYRKCLRAVDQWEGQDANVSAQRRQEYMQLLEELRGEIQAWLEVMETGSFKSPGATS